MGLLSKIAGIEAQSAYCAYNAGFKHEVTYTIEGDSGYLPAFTKV